MGNSVFKTLTNLSEQIVEFVYNLDFILKKVCFRQFCKNGTPPTNKNLIDTNVCTISEAKFPISF